MFFAMLFRQGAEHVSSIPVFLHFHYIFPALKANQPKTPVFVFSDNTKCKTKRDVLKQFSTLFQLVLLPPPSES